MHLRFQFSAILIVLLCSSLLSVAQNKKPNSVDWILDASNSGVNFYHAYTNCSGDNAVLLKLVNNNKYAVKVTWKELFGTNDNSQKIEGSKGEKNLVVKPGQVFSSGCSELEKTPLLVLPTDVSLTHKVQIKSFDFSKIQVSIAK